MHLKYGKDITIHSVIDVVGRLIALMHSYDIYNPLSSPIIWSTCFTPPVGCPNGERI